MIVCPNEAGKNPFSIHRCHDTSANQQQLATEFKGKKSELPLKRDQNHNKLS
jgi:hypothetical protein